MQGGAGTQWGFWESWLGAFGVGGASGGFCVQWEARVLCSVPAIPMAPQPSFSPPHPLLFLLNTGILRGYGEQVQGLTLTPPCKFWGARRRTTRGGGAVSSGLCANGRTGVVRALFFPSSRSSCGAKLEHKGSLLGPCCCSSPQRSDPGLCGLLEA